MAFQPDPQKSNIAAYGASMAATENTFTKLNTVGGNHDNQQ